MCTYFSIDKSRKPESDHNLRSSLRQLRPHTRECAFTERFDKSPRRLVRDGPPGPTNPSTRKDVHALSVSYTVLQFPDYRSLLTQVSSVVPAVSGSPCMYSPYKLVNYRWTSKDADLFVFRIDLITLSYRSLSIVLQNPAAHSAFSSPSTRQLCRRWSSC